MNPLLQGNGTASMNALSYIKGKNVAVTTILPSEKPLGVLGYTKVNISKIKHLPVFSIELLREAKKDVEAGGG